MNEQNKVAADDALVEKAKQLFDESVAGLDGETQSKLNRRRQMALAELAVKPRRWMQWAPASGLAAAAVAAFVIWTGNPQFEELVPPAVATDMEILLTEDSLEMIEDLEFYSWIDFDAEATGEPGFENPGIENKDPEKNVG